MECDAENSVLAFRACMTFPLMVPDTTAFYTAVPTCFLDI